MARSGSNRVIRGGSWNNNPQNLRSANRNNNTPDNSNDNIGFRLVSTKVCQLSAVHGLHFRASGFVQAITQCQRPQGAGRIKKGPQRPVAEKSVERRCGPNFQMPWSKNGRSELEIDRKSWDQLVRKPCNKFLELIAFTNDLALL